MPELNKCRMCGNVISPEAITCPHCGVKYPQVPVPNQTPDEEAYAPFPGAEAPAQEAYSPYQGMETQLTEAEPQAAQAPAPITHPRTIEELSLYCTQHGMPLEKMRFFIGVDYRQPRAFGIYREGDRFVVYKNKDNGNRSVRYNGPDEAYAVNELFTKLLDECHNRGIYPDGQPAARDSFKRFNELTKRSQPSPYRVRAEAPQARSDYMARQTRAADERRRNRTKKLIIAAVVIALILGYRWYSHRHDGYYRFGDAYYYLDGDDWFYYAASGWLESDYDPNYYYGSDYDDYYIGDDYDPGWGVSDVTYSDAWEESDSGGFFSWFDSDDDDDDYDYDYDDWDSGDTDWDSDW